MGSRSVFGVAALIVAVCAGTPAFAGDAAARMVIPFSGILDLKASKVVLTLGLGAPQGSDGAGAVILEMTRPSAGRYDLKADIRHVDSPAGDLAAVLEGHFQFTGPDAAHRELAGEVATRYMLVDYKPVQDFYLKFSVGGGRLTVDPLLLGALSARGHVGLTGAHEMDAAVDLLSADLDVFWPLLHGRGSRVPSVTGLLTGSLAFKGPLAKPVVSGKLTAYNGRWKDVGYDTIDLRFEGVYPGIRFKDSRIIPSEGPGLNISGSIDMSDLGRLATQVSQLKREVIVADDAEGRTRAFRLNASEGHTTRLRSFVSGDADGRNQGEQVIGLEKRIGF